MSDSETLDPLHPHSWVAKCFFAIGFVDGLSCTLLILAAAIGLFLKPIPRPYALTAEILAIVLLVASAIGASTFISEWWIALFGGNRFERYAYFQARGAMRSVVVSYALSFVPRLLPQCFWIPRCRKSMLAVLLIAIGASLPHWYERWALGISW
jgi:hypothetical protein